MGEMVRKGTLNIACPSHPTSLPRLTDHPSCGRFTKNQQKNSYLGPGLFALYWTEITLQGLKETQHWLQRGLPATGLIQQISAKKRLADEGTLRENGGGYTFFWRGKPEAEDRLHGVGFAIRTSLMKSIPSLPVGINERLIKLHLPLTKPRHLTAISAYAPTLTNFYEAKKKFYEDPDQLIRSTSPNDKLLIMGDFNVRVGKDLASWKRIFGSHGVGKMNSNGLLLLS